MSTSGGHGPLRERHFRLYFASRIVNLMGALMAPVALAFAVLQISDSPTALGVVLAAHSIPMVVFLLGGGVLADRFGRTLGDDPPQLHRADASPARHHRVPRSTPRVRERVGSRAIGAPRGRRRGVVVG